MDRIRAAATLNGHVLVPLVMEDSLLCVRCRRKVHASFLQSLDRPQDLETMPCLPQLPETTAPRGPVSDAAPRLPDHRPGTTDRAEKGRGPARDPAATGTPPGTATEGRTLTP